MIGESLQVNNQLMRELIAETLGTFLLVFMGQTVQAVIIAGQLGKSGRGTASFGWGVATYLAVQTVKSVSAHLNPAVTLAFATVGKFPVWKILPFFCAQYLGAFLAAAMTYFLYRNWIMHFAGGLFVSGPKATAQIFTCIPPDHVQTTACVLDQIVGTAMLLIGVELIIDPRRGIPANAHSGLVGGLVATIVYSLAHNSMASMNPARDVGPRIFVSMIGYGSKIFTRRNYDFLLISVVASHIGACVGVWLYRLFVLMHYLTEAPNSVK